MTGFDRVREISQGLSARRMAYEWPGFNRDPGLERRRNFAQLCDLRLCLWSG